MSPAWTATPTRPTASPRRRNIYQRGTTNFAPIITRVLATNPDAVDTASSAARRCRRHRQAASPGRVHRRRSAVSAVPAPTEILRVSGGMDVLKDFYWYEAVPTDDPKVQAIDDEYRKLLGKDPVGGTTFWADLPAARMTMKAGPSPAPTMRKRSPPRCARCRWKIRTSARATGPARNTSASPRNCSSRSASASSRTARTWASNARKPRKTAELDPASCQAMER